jgi:hypothetical protein
MNVFTTDHPMMSEPSAFMRRFQRRLLLMLAGYFCYVLLLGPFSALDGRGLLGFVPDSVRTALVLPVVPLSFVPGFRRLYFDYLGWWYHDPNEPYGFPD